MEHLKAPQSPAPNPLRTTAVRVHCSTVFMFETKLLVVEPPPPFPPRLEGWLRSYTSFRVPLQVTPRGLPCYFPDILCIQ